VAEECFEKANAATHKVARSMTPSEVEEHHKLVATGLACLDVALKSNKLWPRLEARLCLRYTSILIEETTNVMEAETTLTRGISVCEKVGQSACRFRDAYADPGDLASFPRSQVLLTIPSYEDPLPAESKGGLQIDREPYCRLYNVRYPVNAS
jgi:hypothetical protein